MPATIMPRLKKDDIRVWDVERDQCGGYLQKKAAQNSFFSKGKYQKRYFKLPTDIPDNLNYTLEYYYHPDDRKPRVIYSLINAAILRSGGTDFTLTSDNKVTSFRADSTEALNCWIVTLEKAIFLATTRMKYLNNKEMKEQKKQEATYVDDDMSIAQTKVDHVADKYKGVVSGGAVSAPILVKSPAPVIKEEKYVEEEEFEDEESIKKPFMVQVKKSPCVRLDIDIASIPPSSHQRGQFEQMFMTDIAKALRIDMSMVEVLGCKPTIGFPELTSVEFDIFVYPTMEDDEEINDEVVQQKEADRFNYRQELLDRLAILIGDTNSPLYNGFVTCKLDPSYLLNIGRSVPEKIPVFSTDAGILEVMKRYQDVQIHNDDQHNFIDLSHFTVYIYYSDPYSSVEKLCPLLVPNPLMLRRRCCFIWPYEIKQALGLTGTLQELYLQPHTLQPKDMPKGLSQPVVFEECARVGGEKAINASRLKAGLTYEVIMEDTRAEVFKSKELRLREIQESKVYRQLTLSEESMALTEAELKQIKEDFILYDKDQNGGISRDEMEELVRIRTQERKDIVEAKYNEFLGRIGVTDELIRKADENKRLYIQHLNEAQAKLLKMFDAADSDGNGILSELEFQFAEWWWIKCTLNPETAHLF